MADSADIPLKFDINDLIVTQLRNFGGADLGPLQFNAAKHTVASALAADVYGAEMAGFAGLAVEVVEAIRGLSSAVDDEKDYANNAIGRAIVTAFPDRPAQEYYSMAIQLAKSGKLVTDPEFDPAPFYGRAATKQTQLVRAELADEAISYLRSTNTLVRRANELYHQQHGNSLPAGANINECFPAGTAIALLGGSSAPIEAIQVGDIVAAFDAGVAGGRDALEGRRVVRLFENITDTWIKLSNGLTVTPGHRFLTADGGFAAIEEILRSGGRIVLEDGSLATVTGEYIHYSEETAHLYEQAEGLVAASAGSLALAPVYKKGWKTYNFEVEGLHTYVAGGVRVHNESYDFVSKYDNQILYPEQISRYDPDTNSWGRAVVWRPANDNTALVTVYVMYVSAKLRSSFLGGKIGVRLIRMVSEWGRNLGAEELHIHSTSGIDAERTDKLLRRLGFATYGGNYSCRTSTAK